MFEYIIYEIVRSCPSFWTSVSYCELLLYASQRFVMNVLLWLDFYVNAEIKGKFVFVSFLLSWTEEGVLGCVSHLEERYLL